MEILLALVCGLGIGAVLGYVGAGGSMLAVPALIYVFGLNPVQATTASLLVVFIGAASGAIPKLKRDEVMIKEALVIWAIGLSTNLTGAYFLPQIPENLVLTGFALVLILAHQLLKGFLTSNPNFGLILSESPSQQLVARGIFSFPDDTV